MAHNLDEDELSLIVEAARLHFVERQDQQTVSERLKKSQSTVSRLIVRAHDLGIVRYWINAPPMLKLAEELREVYKRRSLDVHVEVVPDSQSDPKNSKNIGDTAGDRFLQILQDMGKKEITVTMSCGKTLWELIRRVDDRLSTDRKLVKALENKTIKLYPTTLYADYTIAEVYPHTLVTVLATKLKHFLPNATVKGYAPTLPTNFFFSLSAKERKDFVKKYQFDRVLDEAAEADIILVGLGITEDKQYQQLSQSFGINVRVKKYPVEVAYIPVGADGQADTEVSAIVVGLSPEKLQKIASDSHRKVIAFGGGTQKRKVINPLLQYPCFNNLIVDAGVAKSWLASLSSNS